MSFYGASKNVLKVSNFSRTIMFGFVTSEGKKKDDTSEEGLEESNPLLKVKPKTFTEVGLLEQIYNL